MPSPSMWKVTVLVSSSTLAVTFAFSANGSVLQHLDALDVARVQIVDTALDRHSVNDVERVAVVDGSDTTDTNLRGCTRLT